MRAAAFALVLISCLLARDVLAAQTEAESVWAQQNAAYLRQNQKNLDRLFAQADQIVGLEAIVAAGSDSAIYSRFGHAMLRFVKADGNFATDSVVSFVAETTQGEIDARKGLLGGYRVLPEVKSLGDFWKEYVSIEGRPLSRFILLSTPSMRAQLLSRLRDWANDPGLSGDYTFLQNNCVGALAKLLEESGFPSATGLRPMIPTHLEEWLSQSLLSPFPALAVESARSLLDRARSLLNLSEEEMQAGKNWPANAAEILSRELQDAEIKRLLIDLTLMPSEARRALVRDHHFGNGGATLDDVMRFRAVPQKLYGICAGEDCVSANLEAESRLWSLEERQEAFRVSDFSYWLVFGDRTAGEGGPRRPDTYDEPLSRAPRKMRRSPELIQYYQILLRAQSSLPR